MRRAWPSKWFGALALFVLAFVVRMLIVTQPIPVQLDKTLPDDSYYYFLTARNIALGHGPSVDGLNDSNGWHPLWMLLTTGIFAGHYADPDTPVRLALGLGALLDSCVAVALYLVARRYIGESALVGGFVYALNSMPIFQSVNGLETGLSAFLVALSAIATLRLVERPSRGRAILWGAVFGLCFLGRTDAVLILIFLGLFVVWSLRRTRQLVPMLALGIVVAAIFVLPWLLWNQAYFGSPLSQTSAVAVPWAARARFATANPGVPFWRESLRVLLEPQYWLRGDYFGLPPLIGILFWPVAAFGLWRARRGVTGRLAALSICMLAGGIALLLVHTLVRWYPRPWYFVVNAQVVSLGLAFFWYVAGMRLRLIAAGIGLPLLIVTGLLAWQVGYYPWQSQLQYAAALWVRDNAPPDAIIASMNSGVIGYYGEHPTVNLDGVVDPGAFDAIQHRRLLAFMQESGVDLFVDVDFALTGEYGPFMGDGYARFLKEIAAVGKPYPGLGNIRAYTVLPPG